MRSDARFAMAASTARSAFSNPTCVTTGICRINSASFTIK
jgi:hypothetical protein